MDHSALAGIVALLGTRSGRDFSDYRVSGLLPRIERRMALLGCAEMGDYLRLMSEDPWEWQRLLADLPIRTTEFFRDPGAWKALETLVLPELVSRRGLGQPVRAWVAGCSTGEEAYSLALVLAQACRQAASGSFRIFATDLDETALGQARAGLYPALVETPGQAERPRGLFEPGGRRIASFLRERVHFFAHDLLTDPPLARIDLLSCRNLLISLEERPRNRVLEAFHACLTPGGFLFLGAAEGAGALFTPVDGPARLFQRG